MAWVTMGAAMDAFDTPATRLGAAIRIAAMEALRGLVASSSTAIFDWWRCN
jgi:hypothetical protein